MSAKPSQPDDLSKKTARNSLYSMGVNGWYLLSRFALTPFILHYLTLAEYGLWSLCFVVLSFLAFTSMGFEGTYIKYVAEYNARDQMHRVNRLLSTGLIITTLCSLLILIMLLTGMNVLLDVLRIDPVLRDTAAFIFLGTGVIFMLDISLNCFARALDGCQYLALTAKIRFWSSCVELACIIPLLYFGYGIHGLMSAFLLRYLIVIFANIFYAYRLIPGLRVGLGYFDISSLKTLVTYGGKMQLLGLIGILMNSFDKLIITSLLGLASTGLYEVGKKMPQKGSRIPAEISGAIMPALSHLQGMKDIGGARKIFMAASRYMAMLSAPLFSYLAVSAPYAIYVWLGPGYEGAAVVMTIICLTTLFHLLTGSSSGAARGLNKLGWEIKYSVVCLVLGVTLTPLFALHFGLAGAAAGVAVSTVVSSTYFLLMTHKFFKISFKHFCRHVLHPVAAALLSALAISFILPSVLSLASAGRFAVFLVLLLFGAVHLGCSAIILAVTRGITEPEKQWLMKNVYDRLRPFCQQLFTYTRR